MFKFLLALVGAAALLGTLRAEDSPATATKEATFKITGMT